MGRDPWSELRDRAERVRRAIESELHVTTPGILQEAPADHGLFSLAAHAWAKELKESPASIATRASRVKPVTPFAPLRHEGPYVNLTVDPAPFAELVLAAVRTKGETYGTSPARKERVLLEHTSANPTGPLHVGRARNPFLGDALVRLLRVAGYPVTSEYLVNDIGRQMVLLYWAVNHLPADPSDSEERVEYRYVKLYQKASAMLEGDEALKHDIERLTQRFEGGDVQLTKDIRKVGEAVLGGILETLRRVNVTYDSFFWESDANLDDLIDEAVDRAYAEVTKRREDLPEAKKREIAETIGVAAVRYNMVRVQSEKAITFRWEEALSLEGNSAPFLQYAHARACSILGKVGVHGAADLRLLVHPQEQMLIRWIAKFPSTVRESAEGRRVHAGAAYDSEFAP